MVTPHTMLDDIRAQPFRAFHIDMAGGRTFEIRHPERIKVLKSYVLIFNGTGENPEIHDEFESASLMLTESIAHL